MPLSFILRTVYNFYKHCNTKYERQQIGINAIDLCLLISDYLLKLILFFQDEHTLHIVTLDLITYIIVGLLSIVGLYISEKYIKKRPKLLTVVSTSAFFTVFAMNIIVPVYHFFANDTSYRPAYTTLFILSCYVFFNITSNMYAALLGFAMSVIHIFVLVFITYRKNSNMIGERVSLFKYRKENRKFRCQ